MNTTKDSFSSKWGLIFAAAGSAIGLGNIWLFPYRAGEYGGAAFVIPYIICLAVFGVVALVGEIGFGRLTEAGPVGAFRKALELRDKDGKTGEFVGWICVLVSLVQAIGYILVVSWVVRFLVGAITGVAFNVSNSTQYFDKVENTHIFLWIVITLFLVGLAIFKGIEKGVEQCCRFMIPAVIVLVAVLAIRVAFLPHAFEGYKYLFVPRWEFLFSPATWMIALGQVFYSLSLRGSTMVVYGSYAKKSEDIVSSAKNIVLLDLIASIVATLLIIPAVFAFNENLKSGPSLLFITMPNIFKAMPLGQLLMILFFVAVFFAALTSLIGMFEVVIEVLQSKFKMGRTWAIILVSIISAAGCDVFVVGNVRAVMDVLELHLIPLCALASGIFLFWIVPSRKVKEELQSGCRKPLGKWIVPTGRYFFCGLVIVIYLLNILY